MINKLYCRISDSWEGNGGEEKNSQNKTISALDKPNTVMNFDNISSAMMMVYDELKNDKKSNALIEKIDTAQSDDTLKDGIKEGVKRLRELDKNALADDIEKKIKGW